jgi:hypothetical protein
MRFKLERLLLIIGLTVAASTRCFTTCDNPFVSPLSSIFQKNCGGLNCGVFFATTKIATTLWRFKLWRFFSPQLKSPQFSMVFIGLPRFAYRCATQSRQQGKVKVWNRDM